MNEIAEKPKSGFNPEQQAAIEADPNHDILISAGAGSGKTKTLSERVFRLIESGEIKPSQLLVLTFTNNAAHEMKERIIARFKAAKSPLADEMPSAHVQTFDSFSQYLVSTYAGRLGIANKIFVANQSVMNAKKAEILDSVMQRYYENPVLKERLVKTLIKFNTRDDRRLKKIILDIDLQLEKMLPQDRKDFIEHYDERFLSEQSYAAYLEEYLEEYKKTIVLALHRAYFIETYYEDLNAEHLDPKRMKEIFSDKVFFSRNYNAFQFSDMNVCEPLYEAILTVLEKDGVDFFRAVKTFPKEYEALLKPIKPKKGDGPEIVRAKAVQEPMRLLFATQKAELIELMSRGDSEEENYGLMVSFKEDIHLLLEIVQEMEKSLFEYKKSISTFTFADISILALRLVTEPQFRDIAQQIRARFKYIMVDEYQDTNDFQETFINSLLEPDENGDRAHLFCVGDAKQSIYAFRNSNVELFRARQSAYESSQINEVIPMNRNYRSGKQLLNEINYIFSYYMRLEHGSIDYRDEKEQLKYDDKVNIYGEPYPGFGIYRIIPDSGSEAENQVEWEAHTTIDTIKKMVDEGYPVYDRSAKGQKIRPCTYKDFAILTRKKAGFALYQRLFNEAGIPLNISVTANLRDIDAIILLQSVISLIAWRKCGLKANVKHLFASVARSYAFQYSDEQIYDLVSYQAPKGVDEENPQRDLALVLQDPIMVTLEDFCKAHWNSSFNTIFLDLLSTFHIIDRLYLLGNVDDNIAKIESLHQMVLAEEKGGEGLLEFVRLFQSIRKYELSLESESDYEVENSVDLMTIHASKGLERKIIMMPASLTSLGKANALNKPDYDFSKELGILLPNYLLPSQSTTPQEDGKAAKSSVYSIPYSLFKMRKKRHDPEVDEHVRLLYVALTRAENAIYIIGDDPIKEGSLYEMLYSTPHFLMFNEKLIQDKLAAKVVDQELYDKYLSLVSFTQNEALPLTGEDLSKAQYEIYEHIAAKFYKARANTELKETIGEIRLQLYLDYFGTFKTQYSSDVDFCARLYAAWKHPNVQIENFSDLAAFAYHLYGQGNEDNEDEEADVVDEYPLSGLLASEQPAQKNQEEIKPPHQENPLPTGDDIMKFLADFAQAMANEDYTALTGNELKAKTEEEKTKETHLKMADAFLDAYAFALEGYDFVCRTSFASALYPDRTAYYHWTKGESQGIIPSPTLNDLAQEQIDDQEIAFETRQKKRASKNRPTDDDTPIQELLDRGVYLHRLMELVDWKTRDVSFIPDAEDRRLVQDILALKLFETTKDGKYLPEYGYYDEDLKTTGFIDLLIIEGGTYTIVDWKTKDIEDAAYVDQLHAYQRNIQRIFGVGGASIRLVLVSLLEKKAKTIAPQ